MRWSVRRGWGPTNGLGGVTGLADIGPSCRNSRRRRGPRNLVQLRLQLPQKICRRAPINRELGAEPAGDETGLEVFLRAPHVRDFLLVGVELHPDVRKPLHG